MTEIIQLLPLNEAIVFLMESHGLNDLEQVGILTMLSNDIIDRAKREAE